MSERLKELVGRFQLQLKTISTQAHGCAACVEMLRKPLERQGTQFVF